MLYFLLRANQLSAILLISIVDVTAIHCVMVKSAILIVFAIFAIAFVGIFGLSDMRSLNSVLSQTVQRADRLSQAQISQRTAFFLAEHKVLMRDLMDINSGFGSNFLFAGLCANFPSNIYFASLLLFSAGLGPVARLQGSILFVAELICFSVGVQPLVYIVVRFHAADQWLLKLQPCLDQRSLRFKLKLHAYYETIHTEEMFYFTFGNLGPISKQSIFEVRSCDALKHI